MMEQSQELIKVENFDPDILLPVSILHDVGYCMVDNKNPNVKDRDSKKIHMSEGAKISVGLLKQAGFNDVKAKQISHLISMHDNWILGDSSIFKKVPEMAAFNDLDYIYPWSNIEQFTINAKSMGLTPAKAFKFWQSDEKLINRPFCCNYTENLYEKLRHNIKNELS